MSHQANTRNWNFNKETNKLTLISDTGRTLVIDINDSMDAPQIFSKEGDPLIPSPIIESLNKFEDYSKYDFRWQGDNILFLNGKIIGSYKITNWHHPGGAVSLRIQANVKHPYGLLEWSIFSSENSYPKQDIEKSIVSYFEKCKKEEDEKLAEKVKLRLEAENRLNQKMSRDREAYRLRNSGK